jgi:hypothetical protein
MMANTKLSLNVPGVVEEVGPRKKVLGKCKNCKKSQIKKDAEHRVALAEAAGQEDSIDEADIEAAEGPVVGFRLIITDLLSSL